MEAFNHDKYIKMQSEKILERINNSGEKLYLEFGGKLFDDHNAKRVLPGFKYNAKIKLLQTLKEKTEIIIGISAKAIEKNVIRGDYGIPYTKDVLRLIDEFNNLDLKVSGVVITQYKNQSSALEFKTKLENYGIKTYIHKYIEGYPENVELLLSDNGYGANDYIETTRPLVVVTAPGPGSGKLAICMSQLYHEHKNGVASEYAKFETFPVWNLPLKHPVNISYEAATANIGDVNMIDPFHLEAYGDIAINYNRDIESFPIVKNMLQKITGKNKYKSPTDMGVNMVGYCIEDDEKVKEAAKQEVVFRYYQSLCDKKKGITTEKTVTRVKLLMNELNITPEYREVVKYALEKSKEKNEPAVAIKLHNGAIITGRRTNIMTAAASVVLNSIKALADIPDNLLLISEDILKPIQKLKKQLKNNEKLLLDTNEVLLALSMCAVTDKTAKSALDKLKELKDVKAHSTYMFADSEESIYRDLKIQITSEPNLISDKLYIQ